jgi:ribosomal protein S18 acetylase RimI-like enzyme
MPVEIKPVTQEDRPWIMALMREHWGSSIVVSRGQAHQPDALPGFVALQQGQRVGLITYHLDGDQCEIVSLDSLAERQGIGTLLIEAVRRAAQAAGYARLWLITTNDNVEALRFYQKRGLTLVQVHRNAVDQVSRRLKPEIPLIGNHGIPIRDELELEMEL